MSQTPEPVPCSVMDTVTESPGTTANGTWREAWGSNSIHAWNWDCPLPVETSCVPAWIRSWLLTPPMPTQVAPTPGAPFGASWGTVHVPVTPVYGWLPVAAYPDQLCEVFCVTGTGAGCAAEGAAGC